DVVVVSSNGSWHANLQVKSSRRKVKFWPVGSKYRDFRGRSEFFVFVRYLEKETRFEAFLAPADKVVKRVDRAEDYNRRHGYKHWAPCFYLPEMPSAIEALRGR